MGPAKTVTVTVEGTIVSVTAMAFRTILAYGPIYHCPSTGSSLSSKLWLPENWRILNTLNLIVMQNHHFLAVCMYQ